MRKIWLFTLIMLGFLNQSCLGPNIPRFQFNKADDFLNKADRQSQKPHLKAHLRGGDLVLLYSEWQVDTITGYIQGQGDRYDYNRKVVKKGALKVSMDSVLIYEMNEDLELPDGAMALIPLAILNTTATILCLTQPKACFGSCPTFYSEDGSVFTAKGEGFSNAISPSLEYGDVDDLRTEASGESFNLIMKNEAQETHCLRSVQLWALPISQGEKAFMTRDKQFYSTSEIALPQMAWVNKLDCLKELIANDDLEYSSKANGEDLASKEELFLEFDASSLHGEKALIVDFRQSLMTTYFIYSALGYMGDEAGDIFAKIEEKGDLKTALGKGLKDELGDLEVYLWDENTMIWIFQGSLYETGPIAINRQIVTLKNTAEKVRVKLVMNRGLWRLNHVALTSLKNKLEPVKLDPIVLKKNGSIHKFAQNQLLDSDQRMVSMPGDYFELEYKLPDPKKNYALHLYSKGYYMEWMRDEWLKEKNLWKLNQMMNHPKRYLKREAGAYKEYEKVMEDVFWSSQIKSKKVTTFGN
jgi:hypothetical protein